MAMRRAVLGLGFTSARKGALCWFGPVEPQARFFPERLCVQTEDGRSNLMTSPRDLFLDIDRFAPGAIAALEINGVVFSYPHLPTVLERGARVRVAVRWRDVGAVKVAGVLFGIWEEPAAPPIATEGDQ